MTFTHDELVVDLAAHLRANTDAIIWEDMQLGPSGSLRPDVYRMERSFVRPDPVAYEVKVNRSDLLRDLNSGKWRNYLEGVSTAVYFAVPTALAIKRDEIPALAGLYVRGETGWRAARAAKRHTCVLHTDVLLKLIIDGLDRQATRHARSLRQRAIHQHAIDAGILDRFGAETARLIARRRELAGEQELHERRTAEARTRYEKESDARRSREHDDANRLWTELRTALGLPEQSDTYAVRSAVTQLRARLTADTTVARLLDTLEYVESTLDAIRSRAARDRTAVTGNEPKPSPSREG